MKHLIWGILGLSIGVFLLFAALALTDVTVITNIVYGGLFVGYGVYRLHRYIETKNKPAGSP